MDYTVGSIADLITGKNTPNKPKVIQTEFKMVHKKPKERKSETKTNKVAKLKTNSMKSAKDRKTFKQKMIKAVALNEQEMPTKIPRPALETTKKTSKKEVDSIADKKPSNTFNAKKRIKKKQLQESEVVVKDRTLFVGNIPLNVSRDKLKRFFSKFGTVEALRIRGVPSADPKVPKKVALIKKQFHPKRNSLHCYVRYATSEEAQNALKLNGVVYKEHHLRVSFASEKEKPDDSKAVFIGNLSFNAEEEELWKLFETCGPITSVRLVRDSRTGMGKGFGYVNFETKDAVELALLVDKPVLDGRELRVSLSKGNKRKKQRKVRVRASRKQKFEAATKAKESESTVESNDEIREVKRKSKKSNDFKSEVNKEKPSASASTHDFVGTKFTDKKKKNKLNKGLLKKKKIIKLLAPK